MGVERAVTRWYIHRQAILGEIAQLETQIQSQKAQSASAQGGDAVSGKNTSELLAQLAKTREKLLFLGPCPKPMMG